MENKEKIEILKIEMTLIQSTLDKYDDLIFRNRNFFITLWLACLGLSFTIKSTFVPNLAAFLSILYWFFEGMMRHQYWFKYVDRYRFLRDTLNSSTPELSEISVYDLTNKYHRKDVSVFQKLKACFFKLEPTILFLLMGAGALLIWYFVSKGVISFPN
ncbi:hypothetical protein [Kangiella sediminilitoris]|uniref:Uncharacterized protein n=1 Tax=Kangiella sediminilitoris TaxID=1144748 RepID=A0A1B3BDM6_9GAMM|nr:hypothetical protein [Kangiella sediminilitoris]AOE50929.1 hypothetical protein KS2013_2224 [Kangiella sediminilitoris]